MHWCNDSIQLYYSRKRSGKKCGAGDIEFYIRICLLNGFLGAASKKEFCGRDTVLSKHIEKHQFDVGFIKGMYSRTGVSFNKTFSHRVLDTHSILRYLFYTGVIDVDISSSAKAFQYFGVKVNDRHTALGDVIATVELFEKMILFMQVQV